MKYWKNMKGDCGTMNDNGYVPDSIEIKKVEYDLYVTSRPVAEYVNEIIEYEDTETGKILKLRKVNGARNL